MSEDKLVKLNENTYTLNLKSIEDLIGIDRNYENSVLCVPVFEIDISSDDASWPTTHA